MIGWNCLAIGTEVRVMTDCTLVANALDVSLRIAGRTQWTIAMNAIVTNSTGYRACDWLIERGEPVAGMNVFSICNTFGTVVPIRAAQTLVSHSDDILFYLLAYVSTD